MLLTVYCVRRDLSEVTFSLQVDADFELHNFRALCELESGIPAAESQVRQGQRAGPPAAAAGELWRGGRLGPSPAAVRRCTHCSEGDTCTGGHPSPPSGPQEPWILITYLLLLRPEIPVWITGR